MPARNSWIWPVVTLVACTALTLACVGRSGPHYGAWWLSNVPQDLLASVLFRVVGPLALGGVVGFSNTRTAAGAVTGILLVAVTLVPFLTFMVDGM